MRKCAITDFGFFGCGSKFLFFHSQDFSYAGESDERGKNFPSRCSLLRQKFHGMVIGIEKIKSSVSRRNFEVRTYILLRNVALSQATYPPSETKNEQVKGQNFFLFNLINSKQEDAKRASKGLG